MDLTSKYISQKDYDVILDKSKEERIVLSNDAYAVCESVNALIQQLERNRIG